MKIAINGIGIAGPTLAWWLKKYGFEPVLFEKSPKLRAGGYIIDFWGVGYDIGEKMGILPEIHKKGYKVNKLKTVNAQGKITAKLSMKALSKVINNRFVSIARGDIASIIYQACNDIESRFGTHITDLNQKEDKVTVTLSNGSKEDFDLVIGADGLHSKIREVTFGPEEKFEKKLGYYVAAFELDKYKPREELTYVMHATPKRQVARFSMRDNKTLFLFTFRSDLINKRPQTEQQKQDTLKQVFGQMKWEVPKILERMSEVKNIYFDNISQIRMDKWTKGRVALLGDASACASLLAGEGTGLAMTESYILAGELYKTKGDYKKAFKNYQEILQKFILKKQKAAISSAGFFAPKSWLSLKLRNLGIKLANIPLFAKLFAGTALTDDIKLPEYKFDTSFSKE